MPRKFFLSAIICLFFAACTVETADEEANDRPAAIIEEPSLDTGLPVYEWGTITEQDYAFAIQRREQINAAQEKAQEAEETLARLGDNTLVGGIEHRTNQSSRYSRLPVRQADDVEDNEDLGDLLPSFRRHLENADEDISPEESDYNESLDPATAAGRSSRFDRFLSQNQKNQGGKSASHYRRDHFRRN